jgi:hypothetical protein
VSDAAPIEFTIRDYLLAQPEIQALVVDRITPVYPDEDAEFPYIIYQASKPKRQRDLDGEKSDIGDFVMTFKLVAENFVQLKLLVKEVTTALEDCTDANDHYAFINIDVEEVDQEGDPEQLWVSSDLVSEITFKYMS